MKKKKTVIIAALLSTAFLAACGGRKGAVVTGQYYNPNQDKAQEDAEELQGTETAEDIGAAVETAASEAPERAADLGSDQFLIVSNDMSEETLVLEQVATGKEYLYRYALSTRFLDKYGNRSAVVNFEPGRVISVREKDNQGKVMEVQISDEVWEYPDVTNYSVDEERGIFKIAGENYSYDEDLFIHADGNVKTLSDLTEMDTIRLVGVGKELISVAVTTGHGELVLKNTELFEGSFIQIGGKIFTEITPDMTIEVPEGTYTVTVANNGYGGSTDVTIESGKKKKLDLDKLKGEGPKFGNILFAVDVEGAILQIDGEVMDYSEPLPLQYGVHTLTVTAENYDTYSKKLFVNSEEATIVIGLSGEDTSASEETASSESTETTEQESETQTNTENSGSGGNQAGTLAGSQAGSQAGSLAGSQTSGSTGSTGTSTGTDSSSGTSGTGTDSSGTSGTGTDSSTGTGSSSDSSTDYLSTLSELLNLLTGESD